MYAYIMLNSGEGLLRCGYTKFVFKVEEGKPHHELSCVYFFSLVRNRKRLSSYTILYQYSDTIRFMHVQRSMYVSFCTRRRPLPKTGPTTLLYYIR